MNGHTSLTVALMGLGVVTGAARAQRAGDPGLDPRVAKYMPPQGHVDFRCDCHPAAGAGDSPSLWPGGVVPFVIDASVGDPVLSIRAMDIWMFRQGTSPNVTFIKRDPSNPSHANYMRVIGVAGSVSSSPVGMSLGEGVVKQGFVVNDYVMAHEYAHTLGFWHEHTRPDRDSFVTVHFGRVYPSTEQHNFQLQLQWPANSLDTGYDFDSVMHYSATAFMNPGCDGGLAICLSVLTCTPLVARADLGYGIYQCTMGQQSFLSSNDVQDMINVYGARPRPVVFVGPNPSEGAGTLRSPFSTPSTFGGGGDVYFEGGSTYHVQAGARFTTAATWRKHSTGVATIAVP